MRVQCWECDRHTPREEAHPIQAEGGSQRWLCEFCWIVK